MRRRHNTARSPVGLPLVCVLLAGLACPTAGFGEVPASACERAGLEAERAEDLPAGLLLAIGRVESGRWEPALHRVVPWPWAITDDGADRMFDSEDAAISYALRARASGDLDVGCFQISLRYHPAAFTDLATAFDPRANAAYAARFLAALKQRLGTWEGAVAAYHSSLPAVGEPYRRLVYAQWGAPPPAAPDQAAVPPSGPTGIRIWTPSAAGTAPAVVTLMPPRAGLPRVIAGSPWSGIGRR
jgi:hypothetical protein